MWSCARCTLSNDRSSSMCEACESPRPGPTTIPSPSKGGPSAKSGACFGCGKQLSGTTTTALGRVYHGRCFVCAGCQRPFSGTTFSVKDGEPYHDSCAIEIFHPNCSHCGEKIGGSGQVTRFAKVPFWGDPLHSECSRRCSKCTGCGRVVKPNKCISLSDKRLVCGVCSQTALFDTSEIGELVADVVKFFWSLGLELPLARPGSRVPELAFPVLLVESDALNETSRSGADTERHSHTRGLCLTESYRVIRYRLGGEFSVRSVGSAFSSRAVDRPDASSVTAVLVLSGLPRVVTGEILAHELMHAHIKSFRFPTGTSHEVEEGLCQLMSFLWLKAQGGDDPDRLREYSLHSLENNEDEAYGEGFRTAYVHYLSIGLNKLLEHVHSCGRFPR
jgi:hypothetical protein